MFKNSRSSIKQASSKFSLFGQDPMLPVEEKIIIDFSKKNLAPKFEMGSDADIGGFSDAKLSFCNKAVHFHGYLSHQLPENTRVKKSGYAMIQSKKLSYSVDNHGFLDTSLCRYLAIHAKFDNRKYFINIKSPSVIRQDLHQHLLQNKSIGEWETIIVPFNQFSLTNNGAILANQMEMYRQKVKSIGFSIMDGRDGPFKLSIAWIKMFNSPSTNGELDRAPQVDKSSWSSTNIKYF